MALTQRASACSPHKECPHRGMVVLTARRDCAPGSHSRATTSRVRACEPQLLSLHSRASTLQLLKPMCSRAPEPQLVRLCATTAEACALQQEKPLQSEACTPQLEGSAHSLQLEKTCTKQQPPRKAKSKKINI